ncbi:hypothetical protein CVS47_02180 [Microbacterium lemovicicum]|uniref:ATPase AAA-type core domain-containing protein n=2 Tax=Microbacterium lemovicicum TaxID=1072463 RepID=A0A3Q9J4B5_9MICO|nr:hypothetical protein CVS47_02180 [Microbacterium lemovicicum]
MRPMEDRREEVGSRAPLVLAVSNLVIDSFPKPRAWNDSYRYLGLRQATNTVSTGSLNSSLGPYLVELMASWGTRIDLGPVLHHVGVGDYDIVVAKRVRPVGEVGTLERLAPSLDNFGLKPPRQAIEALDGELSDVARDLDISRSLGTGEVLGRRLASLATYFDLHPAILLVSLRRVYGLTLDVRFDGRLEAKHSGLSAGQAMLLSMVVRIAAAIRPGSLVLIDEPETGTHPDWQSSFIPMIKETLPPEAASHFFIASHSPFLVSDANDVLRADGSPLFEEVTSDVRGMSVEGILYRIFGTRVVGNSAVDADLTRVVTWISGREQGAQTPSDIIGAAIRLEGISSEETPTVNAILAELVRVRERPAS